MINVEYKQDDKLIYEFQQDLENLYLNFPFPFAEVKKSDFDIKILPTKLKLGLKGEKPFLDETFFDLVEVDESLWFLDFDLKKISFDLKKTKKNLSWTKIFKNHEGLNVFQKEELKKQMLKDKFTEEHRGFDFSNSEIEGQIPDARTFLA